VPPELQRHSSVRARTRRLGRRPSETLPDNSWNHAAMRGLEDGTKRGRPDIVHPCLPEATSIPLYREGGIRVYVHTAGDGAIRVGQNVNLPRSHHRSGASSRSCSGKGGPEAAPARCLSSGE